MESPKVDRQLLPEDDSILTSSARFGDFSKKLDILEKSTSELAGMAHSFSFRAQKTPPKFYGSYQQMLQLISRRQQTGETATKRRDERTMRRSLQTNPIKFSFVETGQQEILASNQVPPHLDLTPNMLRLPTLVLSNASPLFAKIKSEAVRKKCQELSQTYSKGFESRQA